MIRGDLAPECATVVSTVLDALSAPADADEWKDKPGKEAFFSPEPGRPK